MTLPTLSLHLSSQEARDAAPCVAVTGPWVLHRNGAFRNVTDIPPNAINCMRDGGAYKGFDGEADYLMPDLDCIWSGDLPALLAAMVAENEARRMHAPTEADQDGHPYWVCWVEEGKTSYDKAIYEPELKRWWAETVNQWITPDRVMRLPMGET